jgi:lysophospholipase L1-like esterase
MYYLKFFKMKHKKLLIIVIVNLIITTCIAQSTTLHALTLKPYGRIAYNESGHLELISGASYFAFSFTGNTCSIYAYINNEAAHNYLQYELDGIIQQRVKVKGNKVQPITINATVAGKHTVRLYKATEAHTGPIFIEKIVGKRLKSLQVTKQPLIEFIGNSITCGAAADTSLMPCGIGEYHDYHNAYQAYGPRVARALKTNFMLSSVSGIGIYRNWNSNGPTIAQVYENTDLVFESNRRWDFKTYNPKIVSIALGTNDFSNGDGKTPRLPFDSALFVSNYISFIKMVKFKYSKAQIALLSSPMLNGTNRLKLQSYITAIKTEIDLLYPDKKKVAIYFFNPMKAGGCTGHPSVADHEIIANELIPFFKKLLAAD